MNTLCCHFSSEAAREVCAVVEKNNLFFSSEILFWIVCDRLVCKTLIQCRVNFGGKLTTTGKTNSALHLTCYDFSLEVMDCSSALLLSAPHSVPHYVNFFLDISMDLFSINMFEECQVAHVWAHRHTQPLQWKLFDCLVNIIKFWCDSLVLLIAWQKLI